MTKVSGGFATGATTLLLPVLRVEIAPVKLPQLPLFDDVHAVVVNPPPHVGEAIFVGYERLSLLVTMFSAGPESDFGLYFVHMMCLNLVRKSSILYII